MAITEDFLAYFGTCKIGLVLRTKYHRNIQTLISKSDISMWQHDLDPWWHHNTTALIPIEGIDPAEERVEGNGPVKGATMGFKIF